MKSIEDLSAEKREAMVIRAQAGGIIKGQIDTQSLGGVPRISIWGAKGSFKVSISPKESRYEVRDLPAGEYELQIYKIEQPNEETGYPESTLITADRLPRGIRQNAQAGHQRGSSSLTAATQTAIADSSRQEALNRLDLRVTCGSG